MPKLRSHQEMRLVMILLDIASHLPAKNKALFYHISYSGAFFGQECSNEKMLDFVPCVRDLMELKC